MTDRTPQQPPKDPYHAHPMRDFLSLDVMIPTQAALIERVFDRIEKGAAS
jgi:hypothetical protein